jgi:hypothetical protein
MNRMHPGLTRGCSAKVLDTVIQCLLLLGMVRSGTLVKQGNMMIGFPAVIHKDPATHLRENIGLQSWVLRVRGGGKGTIESTLVRAQEQTQHLVGTTQRQKARSVKVGEPGNDIEALGDDKSLEESKRKSHSSTTKKRRRLSTDADGENGVGDFGKNKKMKDGRKATSVLESAPEEVLLRVKEKTRRRVHKNVKESKGGKVLRVKEKTRRRVHKNVKESKGGKERDRIPLTRGKITSRTSLPVEDGEVSENQDDGGIGKVRRQKYSKIGTMAVSIFSTFAITILYDDIRCKRNACLRPCLTMSPRTCARKHR